MADMPHPPSPCTNLCTVDPATDVCRGCGRTMDEIARWGWMTAEEKTNVLRRIEREWRGDESR